MNRTWLWKGDPGLTRAVWIAELGAGKYLRCLVNPETGRANTSVYESHSPPNEQSHGHRWEEAEGE